MKHLGDITKIHGAAVEPVEVIIGGSPCQDLSIAGKRAGLAGERSGLFMEQIRIIKEMRRKSERSGANVIIPRFMVWENVPGTFNSNGGEDFRAVLEETARVADFGGYTAPEILFERNGLSRNTPPSPTPWKDFAAAIAERFGGANSSERTIEGPGPYLPTYCIQGNCVDRADTAACNGKGWTEDI